NAHLARVRHEHPRAALAGAAALGDPQNLDWVLELLDDPALARPAADVLSCITGLRLAEAKLETHAPDNYTGGPSDDPRDDDVAIDPFDSLPWPDPARVREWWSRHGDAYRFGERYLAGRPLTE